jgi:LPS O-antigen subunit length determinant protein (WzzB/FepE family)
MDDEIDLGKIILNLWEGKWKILISAVIAFIISLGLIFSKPQPNYQATTELKPINFY